MHGCFLFFSLSFNAKEHTYAPTSSFSLFLLKRFSVFGAFSFPPFSFRSLTYPHTLQIDECFFVPLVVFFSLDLCSVRATYHKSNVTRYFALYVIVTTVVIVIVKSTKPYRHLKHNRVYHDRECDFSLNQQFHSV